MRILSLNLLIAIISSSCSFIARSGNDASMPRIENASSIHGWLDKNRLRGYSVVTVSPESFLGTCTFFEKRKLIFNRNGKVAELGTNSTGVVCHFTTPREIQELEPDFSDFTEYLLSIKRSAKSIEDYNAGKFTETTDTTYFNIDSLNKYLHTPDGRKMQVVATPETDFLVVIPFAKYYGRTIQITDIKRYIKAIKENPKSNFQIILLNLDKQDWWDEESKKRIKLKV
ncbi:MAG TPA: hypothetical protein VGD22_12560 [Sphingobacteriaceae bacterium]